MDSEAPIKAISINLQCKETFTDENLKEVFSECGEIIRAAMAPSSQRDSSNPSGYVEFKTPEAVQNAMKMNNTPIKTQDGTLHRIGVIFADSVPRYVEPLESDTLRIRTKAVWSAECDAPTRDGFMEFAGAFSPESCKIKNWGMERDIGFVKFPDVETAKKAKEALEGKDFMGRPVHYLFANPRPPKKRTRNKKTKQQNSSKDDAVAEDKPQEAGETSAKKKSRRRRRRNKGAKTEDETSTQDATEESSPSKPRKRKNNKKGSPKEKKQQKKRSPEESAQSVEPDEAPKNVSKKKKKLFLKPLAPETTQEDLLNYFKTFGEVKQASVKEPKENEEFTVGYVTFANGEDANRALGKTTFHTVETEIKYASYRPKRRRN